MIGEESGVKIGGAFSMGYTLTVLFKLDMHPNQGKGLLQLRPLGPTPKNMHF